MPVAAIKQTDSLDHIWEELVYTEAKLLNDTRAKQFVTTIGTLRERTETITAGQRAAWRAEIQADAAVDSADEALDDGVTAFAKDLLYVTNDRTSPRFKRYFSEKPSDVIRLGLESELTKVRPWPVTIAQEPEAQLKSHADLLKQAVQAGDQAIAQRQDAQTKRADQRLREIVKLVDDVNGARKSIYGSLVSLAAQHGLGSDWPERFFRHAQRSPKAPAALAPEAPKA